MIYTFTLRTSFIFSLTASFLIPLSLHSQANNYAIKNISVIPMNREILLNNQTILISEGKIQKTGNSDKINIPEGYTIVDAMGKYIMPGLFDMHTHFLYEQGEHKNTCDKELKLMLANGVTTARIMAGHPAYLEARENVNKGKWQGPELFVVSPQLAGQWPFPKEFKNYELTGTKEKAISAVKKFKQEGYSEIKLTFKIDPEVYQSIIETAQKENIKVTGHVGPLVKLPAALAGKQQVEHMDEFIEMLLPDTSYNHGQSVSDYNIYSKKAWATVPHLDESKIAGLVERVKQAGIYVTPTNYFFISCFGMLPSDEEIKQMPDYDFIPADLKEEKWQYRRAYMKKMEPEASRKKYVSIRYKMVNALVKAGVPLMAGSDAPEFFNVTGISLHGELRHMVEAGLTPFAAL